MSTAPPGTKGDPHFKTHGGERYDFHGGCDLVLINNPDFMKGLGMRVHIRTKIETWWSYVESAVVQIGDDTVEIHGGDINSKWLLINGKPADSLKAAEWYLSKISGLHLRYKNDGKNGEAHIYFGNSQSEKLVLQTFADFVKVDLNMGHKEGVDYYNGSLGLLGRFPDGKRVGRDGQTFIENVNDFGMEWQVKPNEPKLFSSYDADWVVPAGQKCAMPTNTAEKRMLRQRRLASGISTEAAEKACSHLAAEDRKDCVFDVIATQNVNMAGAW